MKKMLILVGAITIFVCGTTFTSVAIEDHSEYPDSGFHPTV
ncbi:MAG TPA: hypothetical protein VK142_02150 [Bacillota bacterium]|nr:hypothetical protein [Bacillota bacterium]